MYAIISHIALIIALAAYATSGGLYLLSFPQKRPKLLRTAFWSHNLGALATAIAVALSFSNAFYTGTSGLILILFLSFMVMVSKWRFGIHTVGLFLCPLITLILLYLAFSYPKDIHLIAESPGLLVTLHIVVSVLGQAFAIGACAISIITLWQKRALRLRRLDQLSKGAPSLEKLEKALMTSLWLGFALISLGLISGAIYSGFYLHQLPGHLVWKTVWAVLVWLWYLSTLMMKNAFNQPSSIVARMSLIGFFLLSLTVFGLKQYGGAS